MKKDRAAYFFATSTKNIFRNKLLYTLSMSLMTVGLVLIYVLLCCLFSYVSDLREKLTDDAWQDILIMNDWIDREAASPTNWDVPAFRKTPRHSLPYIASETDILTHADLDFIENTYQNSLTLKAHTQVRFSTDQNDYTMFFITDGYVSSMIPSIDFTDHFLIISKESIDNIKMQLLYPTDAPRQFPYNYDKQRDQFTTFEGEIVSVYYLEDLEKTTFYTRGGAFERVAANECILAPMRDYFSVYFPMDNYNLEMRVKADDPRVLGAFLEYMNTAHKGYITYSCIGLIDLQLQTIDDQVQLFAILFPMSILMVLMISINFGGLLILHQRRRQRDLAIQMACGASPAILSMGLLYSSVVALLLASGAALLLGTCALHILELSVDQVIVIPKMEAIWITELLAGILGILSCVPSMIAIHKLTPIEILASEVEHD